MLLILLVAAGLRFWALPKWPLGLHYDEAANGILTQQIASGGYRPLFIRAYTGKEVLFFYTAAPWVAITGNPALGLRLNAAMTGILTVAATFAATRALLGNGPTARRASLLAAGWVAVAFPHLIFSRYGFRAISQPLLQALTVAALWHGLRTGQRSRLVLAGICLGLTGYTYLAARLFPIPLALALGWLLVRTRGQYLGQLALVLAIALAVFAPLGVYFLRNPEAFSTRIHQVAATSGAEALRGFWLCARALIWPGAGDAYIRFNAPGRPLLDPISAILALIGLWALRISPHHAPLDRAARLFLPALIVVMLFPSALATGEITPSNLRLIGLWPFLATLPALGVLELAKFARLRQQVWRMGAWALLGIGAVTTGSAYHAWATSPGLFYAADGEMALAAQVLDETDLSHTTVYIAARHYRHPTVAALARQYPQAKWLTGGATLVLPPQGDALYLIPRTLPAPAPWPEALTQSWDTTTRTLPNGEPALDVHRLSADTIAALRPTTPVADFAHVVRVYAAHPSAPCRPAEPCPVLVTWEALAPYPALEPVVRLLHPTTGEWARMMVFHYPPEQWTPGDIILDQYTLTPPVGTPPGDDYQIGVGFFNPDADVALPRLQDERFAGLEVRFPVTGTGFSLLPMQRAPTPEETKCPSAPRREEALSNTVRLLGRNDLATTALPGAKFNLTICWQALQDAPNPNGLQVFMAKNEITKTEPITLYAGPPTAQYPFSAWRAQEILEGRYALSYPKESAPGNYTLWLSVDDEKISLGEVNIQPLERILDIPEIEQPFEADFESNAGEAPAHTRQHLRLLGYAASTLQAGEPFTLTLYWQAVTELQEDYTVFVHVINPDGGQTLAQVDEAPRHNTYPTSLWLAGEIVRDEHTVTIPAGLPPGDYTLRIGLYVPETGEHLHTGGNLTLTLPEIKMRP
ncbi:MAG: hypothetical protein JXA21_12690 [Anaerolineae bacterium]|nr:hypothetical protein [Anaerolineae bacterium]